MSEGRKNDEGKLRYDLIPPVPLEALAAVYTLGAKKYGAHNWRKGLAWSRVYAALVRHLQAWWQGETHAQDDGQHHLASVLWCAMTLMEYERMGTGEDDRDASIPMFKPQPSFEMELTLNPNFPARWIRKVNQPEDPDKPRETWREC